MHGFAKLPLTCLAGLLAAGCAGPRVSHLENAPAWLGSGPAPERGARARLPAVDYGTGDAGARAPEGDAGAAGAQDGRRDENTFASETDPLDPAGEHMPLPWPSSGIMLSFTVVSPVFKSESNVRTGEQYAIHITQEFNRHHAVDVSGAFYLADINSPIPLFTGPTRLESLAVMVAWQIGDELPFDEDIGRWFVGPTVGVFFFDEDEVTNDAGEGVGEDLAVGVTVGVEIWSLRHPVRSRVEFGYLRLEDLEEQFFIARVGLVLKF